MAFKQQGDSLLLNGGRLLVTDLFQGCQDAGVQAQVGETYAFFFSLFGGCFCSSFCGGFFCFYSRALNGVLGDVLSGHNGLCLGVQFGRGSSILSQFFLYTVGVEAHAFRRLPGVPFTAQPHIIPWGVERPGVLRYRRILRMLRVAAFAGGGLEFLGTLSARLFVLCAWRTVVPVDQGCTGWVMLTCNVTYSWWFAFPLTRRWCVCYSRRSIEAGPEIVKRSPRVRCKP